MQRNRRKGPFAAMCPLFECSFSSERELSDRDDIREEAHPIGGDLDGCRIRPDTISNELLVWIIMWNDGDRIVPDALSDVNLLAR